MAELRDTQRNAVTKILSEAFRPPRAVKVLGVVALTLVPNVQLAQNSEGKLSPNQAVSEKRNAASPEITYVNGQLKISGLNLTLASVLTKVSALTGVKIDLPDGAGSERMPVVELGPGPAPEVLAALLSDSNFDYLIQGSDSDPRKLQNLLLLPREKNVIAGVGASKDVPRPFSARAMPQGAPLQEAPVPARDNSIPNQPDTAAAAPPSSAPPDQPMPPAAAEGSAGVQQEPGRLNGLRIAPLPVPTTLDQPTINQQLQQMYQQRMQLQPQQAAPQQGAPQQTTRP